MSVKLWIGFEFDMNAEHLILETVFNDMLQLPHSLTRGYITQM